MLRREYEGIVKQEFSEVALQAAKYKSKEPYQGWKGRKEHKKKTNFKCFHCNRNGHMKKDCWKIRNGGKETMNEQAFSSYESNTCGWILDSGASSHMSFKEDDFRNLKAITTPINILVANGAKLEAIGIGSVHMKISNDRNIRVENVLYVRDLDKRLLSISAMNEKGLKVVFGQATFEIKNGDDHIITVARSGKLFIINGQINEHAFIGKAQKEKGGSEQTWHARHCSEQKLDQLGQSVTGYDLDRKSGRVHEDTDICVGCMEGKASKKPFPLSTYGQVMSARILELVHSDIMGPMKTVSQGNSKYVATFIDDFSRFVKVYFLKSKAEVVDAFMEYKSLMENQCDSRIKCIRSDNGTEYVNRRFGNICRKSGIRHQTTVPYSPQQNGIAERMNRTITERA
uniref:Putative polyprotein n=1 Tax=Albugo laibachii Nc14 TaxID=890382 RepID=F0WTK1_9STRA|nr:putative polyprotein [Albugo laibachii Nc14]|eukprot:CCA24692.1 putative polyprotein [Albugo laibachii Nc14]